LQSVAGEGGEGGPESDLDACCH
ncbi:Cu(I)-responsive transcriptional regulator, partial [Klebsiella pneumoniae]|nr:Cu(I)-responsive transcriptional regulator [Klebsiella pneumoniae]